ncbi:hypothetical protein H6P81_017203 [Aristolochia fimbriata]|uniref:Small ribosomal subunit protein uS10c n=1 Tax=Aristolochia fimbriata TaxID=158543 RepID=A0AAV7DXT7_ARIFI|nr:hypothetical protein H6P81_017203 [Aristolochia fimbriata]
MAISSVSASLSFLPLCKPSSSKPTLFAFPSTLSNPHALKPVSIFSSSFNSLKALAAPEALEAETEDPLPEIPDGPDTATFEDESELPGSTPLAIGADVDMMAPKQKIRIKLKSYWVPLIEDSCKQIMDVARTTNAKTMGPVPLPTKKRIYCVLKSPHVHKDARFHFEIRTHQRLIDILYPTAQTIDSLMQLDLPAGVDVNVKL